MASEFSVIGKAMPRHDAVDKALGLPVYASDAALPGMFYGAVCRSAQASARLVSVDTSAAEALPGVVAVITAQDVPNNQISMSLPGRMAEATAGGTPATLIGFPRRPRSKRSWWAHTSALSWGT